MVYFFYDNDHSSPTFNRWLKRRRAQVDLTQEALAELAFCSVQAIRAFATGRRRPSLPLIDNPFKSRTDESRFTREKLCDF